MGKRCQEGQPGKNPDKSDALLAGDNQMASKMGKEKRGHGMGCLESMYGQIRACHGWD